jgi:hypothetical protein
MRDDRVDAGLNATLDTGSVMFKILFCLEQLRHAFTLLTSIPACRDAPCNETKGRYFEFKRLIICESIKISVYFYFSCIKYLSRTLLTY